MKISHLAIVACMLLASCAGQQGQTLLTSLEILQASEPAILMKAKADAKTTAIVENLTQALVDQQSQALNPGATGNTAAAELLVALQDVQKFVPDTKVQLAVTGAISLVQSYQANPTASLQSQMQQAALIALSTWLASMPTA